MADSASSEWRKLFREALAASGDGLQTKIDAVEGAIFFRLQELESRADAAAERSDMQDALNAITELRAKKSTFSRRSGVWAGHSPRPKLRNTQGPSSSTRGNN